MIPEERSPALRWWAPVLGHVLGNRSLADIDAELEEFSMDARSAPERVCQAHLADQLPNFEGHLGPAGSSSRLPRIHQKQIDKLEHPAFFAQFGRSGQADGICGRDSCFQLYFGAQTPGNTGTFPHPCTVSEDRDWRAVRLSPNSGPVGSTNSRAFPADGSLPKQSATQ